jgi:glycosyltransferase involved in cell wall biosynthesis
MKYNSTDTIVGILIPTYNRLDLLDICVSSALAQSYRNIKIIIIDNGHQDGNIKLLYENKDERLSYIGNNNNIGLIGSINKGIELMPSEVTWCTILCDDDALHEDYLKESLMAIKEHNAKSVVDCHRIFIDKDGNIISDAIPAASEISATEYIKKRLAASRQTYLTGILFNRDAFEKIGGYPRFTTGMASDDAFIFSLSIKDRLIYNHKAKAYIRIHEEAESNALENIPLILKTISEFRLYCQNKTKDIAFSSQKDADGFIRVLKKYIIRLNSGCWLKKAHDILFSQQPNKRDLLSDLCKIVKNSNFLFSHRVYFNRFLFEKFGLFPETSLAYRMLWDLIEGDLKICRIRRFL